MNRRLSSSELILRAQVGLSGAQRGKRFYTSYKDEIRKLLPYANRNVFELNRDIALK